MKRSRLGWVLLFAALPALAEDAAPKRPKLDLTPKRVDESPAALSKSLDEALAAGSFENALYAYRSLVYATGAEDAARLGKVAHLALVDDMRHGKNWIRLGAAEALARRGDAEAVALLRSEVSNTAAKPVFRLRAIEVLGEIRDAAALPVLAPLPFDPARSAPERLAAADSLLALGDVGSASYLVGLLAGPRGPDRLRAAEILGERKVTVVDALRRAAQVEGDSDLHIAALRGLALQGDAEALSTLRRDFGENPELVLPVIESRAVAPAPGGEGTPPEEVPQPTRKVDVREVVLRLKLAHALFDLGDPRPVPYVAKVIREGSLPGNQGLLAARIAKFDPALGLELLRVVLADSDPDSVAYAAEELVRLKHPEGVVEALSATYRWSKSTDTSASGPRQRPVEALSRSQLPAAIPLLREALADPEATIRIAAASGLARLGEAEGLTELRRILDGGQPADALRAAEALVDIGSTAPTPTSPAR